MKLFDDKSQGLGQDPVLDLKTVQAKFENFISILENNNQILKIIGNMEEKSQGDCLFDIKYIRENLDEIRRYSIELVNSMIALGGDKYDPLRGKYAALASRLDSFFPGSSQTAQGPFTISFKKIDGSHSPIVGGKNAQLGNLKSKLGLPVPEGFAISTRACNYFFEANNLESLIRKRLKMLSASCMDDLLEASSAIRQLIVSSPVPDDLSSEILGQYDKLIKSTALPGVALRSSAIGEDTAYSFAGQYATFLNVVRSDLIKYYREVLASKFTPQAIYYALSHSLSSSDLAMGVGCISMIDARASGVIYTRNPIMPEQDSLLVHSIFGLGKYLVEGTQNPDVFLVSRKNYNINESHIAVKASRLILDEDNGIKVQNIPEADQQLSSVNGGELAKLAEFAMKIEEFYNCPQDIEWAIDQHGRIFILQARPLNIVESNPAAIAIDTSNLKSIFAGGVTICPGAGSGEVFRASSINELSTIPEGAVLVTPSAFPGIVTVMNKVSAIVTCIGNVASHMATLAREYKVPTVGGIANAMTMCPGQQVTVDATQATIYSGIHPALVQARKPDHRPFVEIPVFDLLKNILRFVAPLNLLHPADSDFNIENCKTIHDITRFIHQKALEEMFYGATHVELMEQKCPQLKSDMPIRVNVIFIDRDSPDPTDNLEITEMEFFSEPMKNFWKGVVAEGWPKPPIPTRNAKYDVDGLATNITIGDEVGFSEQSFALLGKQYMMMSIRMGYHYSAIEAFCSSEPNKNYIRMQYKEGGASIDRRMRRIKLIIDLLKLMGFEYSSRGDFLEAGIAYQSCEDIARKLYLLGRITIKTKQLDMALSNDAVARWFTEEYINTLGLRVERRVQ
jgi:pyruvate,water dikinase